MADKIKMDYATRLRWIKALRSGEYKQGKHRLKGIVPGNGDAPYCCLGVVCDLVKDKVKGQWDDRTNSTCYVFYDNLLEQQASGTALTKNVKHVLFGDEFKRDNHQVTEFINSLIALNDDGKDFTYIADFIQRNTKGVKLPK